MRNKYTQTNPNKYIQSNSKEYVHLTKSQQIGFSTKFLEFW